MPLTLVQVTPDRLEFPARNLQQHSPGHNVCVWLNLRNISPSAVAYKIKTTAPKNYLVRPSSGVLAQNKALDVQIVLQPNVGSVAAQDRFLVQATAVSSPDQDVTRDFWSSVRKENLEEQRLAVFLRENLSMAGPAASAMNSAMAGGSAAAPQDFEAKYNELLQYSLALEKEKTALATELEELKRSSSARRPAAATTTANGGFLSQRIELTHVLVLLVLVAIAMKWAV